ncbi:GNAT family N-acetyltransferase [Microbacterium sp. SYP-A9085]|uniref:GNAT family N-acetyltransferase n=1 Tax=Microbacterium sp. SYP-A9085 TaxID=2664454 RepID=UPI00129C08FC|nr:GNAT family N-acetyltransferase [Microbacterium sp. SYP-A9085]MRH30373.1 GNAT family N-acetyltransferase [Microbacterium sp. SYP-A9085]
MRTLSEWQTADWKGFLHPGDLGWHSMVGAEKLAADLRCWTSYGSIVAIGMFDGDDLFRMAMDPSALDDDELASQIEADLTSVRVLPRGTVTVEARGALALQARLRAQGWDNDEPWTPLLLDLCAPIPPSPRNVALRVEEIGLDEPEEWTAVHWSAFKGGTLSPEEWQRLIQRWTTMATGPFAGLAHHLIGYDTTDQPVAIATVWTAGNGRPGLIEPMGVHGDHHGHGYGTAITLAGAHALQQHGASTAAVVAENSNDGALATYLAAGFTAGEPVADLTRTQDCGALPYSD